MLGLPPSFNFCYPQSSSPPSRLFCPSRRSFVSGFLSLFFMLPWPSFFAHLPICYVFHGRTVCQRSPQANSFFSSPSCFKGSPSFLSAFHASATSFLVSIDCSGFSCSLIAVDSPLPMRPTKEGKFAHPYFFCTSALSPLPPQGIARPPLSPPRPENPPVKSMSLFSSNPIWQFRSVFLLATSDLPNSSCEFFSWKRRPVSI